MGSAEDTGREDLPVGRPGIAASWLLVALVLGSAAASLAAGDPVWTGFAVAVATVAVLPPALTRDPTAVVPPELLALAALPVVGRAVGAHVPGPSPLAQAAGYAGVAALGLVIVAELTVFGAVELTRGFAVGFVVMTTMAVAALWAVGRYLAAVTLGTPFTTGQALMVDLVTATGVGVLAGVVLDGYLQWRHPASGLRPDGTSGIAGESDVLDGDVEGESPPGSAAGGVESRSRTVAGRFLGTVPATAAVRVIQGVLVAVVGYGVVAADVKVVVNSAVPLAVALFPTAVRRRYGYHVGDHLALWIAVTALLHVVGTFGPYATVPLYDQVAHAVSAGLVAAVGYALALTVDAAARDVRITPDFRFVFILVFVLAVGVAWEILELLAGWLPTLLGADPWLVQYGAADTALDLLFDALGGVAVALWGGGHVHDAAAGVWTLLVERGAG